MHHLLAASVRCVIVCIEHEDLRDGRRLKEILHARGWAARNLRPQDRESFTLRELGENIGVVYAKCIWWLRKAYQELRKVWLHKVRLRKTSAPRESRLATAAVRGKPSGRVVAAHERSQLVNPTHRTVQCEHMLQLHSHSS